MAEGARKKSIGMYDTNSFLNKYFEGEHTLTVFRSEFLTLVFFLIEAE